ncbi:MAG TPA: STAS domain-containing protein [Cyclobacteriaceae bacterium]
MKFTIDRKENYTSIKPLNERVDTSVAPDLKSEFVTLQAEDVRNVIVDLSEVKYIDSSGLSALLVGNRIFSEKGAFILCNIQEHAMKLISISQLDKVLDILPTLEEAVDAIFLNEIENQINKGEEDN